MTVPCSGAGFSMIAKGFTPRNGAKVFVIIEVGAAAGLGRLHLVGAQQQRRQHCPLLASWHRHHRAPAAYQQRPQQAKSGADAIEPSPSR
jgi:hypothetical protein